MFTFYGPLCLWSQGKLNFLGKDSTRPSINLPYMKSYLLDCKDIFFAPTKWNEQKAGTAFALLSLTATSMLIDKNVRDFSQTTRNKPLDAISTYFLEPIGGGPIAAGVLGLTYVGGMVFKDPLARKTSMLSFKAATISVGIAMLTKVTIQRARPNTSPNDPFVFYKPEIYGNDYAFVSGHTIFAFSIATVYATEYSHKKWVAPLAYTIASLASLSRVYDNKHWLSDVVAGAALGYGIGKLVSKRNNWGLKRVKIK